MSNNDKIDGSKLSRSEYNRRYYAQNKARLLEQRKGKPSTMSQLAPVESSGADVPIASARSCKRLSVFFRAMEVGLLIVLTGLMTYLLVNESAGFYLDANESPLMAYSKATMIEATAVLFSFSRSRMPLIQWGQRGVLLLLCGLSLWTMSQRVIRSASQDTLRTQVSAKIIHELESERTQKEELREKFLARGWLGVTRRYEKSLDQIREKLIAAQQDVRTLTATEVIANSLGVLIAFRLILLVSNLICIHRVAEYFGARMQRDTG